MIKFSMPLRILFMLLMTSVVHAGEIVDRIVATVNGHAAGCCCLQRLDQNNCEMKRLYVRPHFRGLGVGHRLTKQIIAEASMLGYDHMLLETITEKMDEAIHLYRQLGFNEIAPYHANTIPSALYMELPLRRPSPDRK